MLSNGYGERVWHVSVHIEDNASRAYRIIASGLAWALYYQFFSFLHLSTTKDWPRKLPYTVFVVDRRAEDVRFVSSIHSKTRKEKKRGLASCQPVVFIPSMYVPAASKQESKVCQSAVSASLSIRASSMS
jgi:hypothetical protein